MSSATKALMLLSHFSTARPQIGLSQMCRLAGRDKATTYRHLQALEDVGFIEQDPASKRYRIGPAALPLAHLREATVPRKASGRAALEALAHATGETAHITVLSGRTVYALDDCEPTRHGIRAVIDITTFPLHATASGLCALAFGPSDLMAAALENPERFTAQTPTTKAALSALSDTIRDTGFARAERIFEDEIQGLSAPLFDHTGHLGGAVAVACVASRFTPELEQTIKSELIIAARAITRNWGGTPPATLEAAWARTVTQPLESTS